MTRRPTGPTKTQGQLFLGFVNSVEDDGKTRRINSFEDGAGLIAFLGAHGLPAGVAAPGAAQLPALLSLRESGFAALSAMAAGRAPGREEALHLELVLKNALRDAQFRIAPSGLRLDPSPLGGLHDLLVLSLLDLLQKADLSRLRECRRCTHLFLDHGRGSGRRWCSMARCGNRAKVETFRQRQRAHSA